MLGYRKQERGFTLVELAIVLVIVGLLIGGILKGQQLMENATITATVSQIKAIESATTSFLDSYGALPGDLLDSDTKIAGCISSDGTTHYCRNAAANDNRFKLGDGIIGSTTWNLVAYQPGAVANNGTALPTVQYGYETLLFWYSLQKSGLINAVKDDAIQNLDGRRAFGVTVPQAEVSGGFWVGYTDSSIGTMPDGTTVYSLLGTVLALVGSPAADITQGGAGHDENAVVPSVAAAIDRKMDDGLPSSGYVQALGSAACTTVASGSMIYNEGNSALDCGVYINIVPQN